MSEKDAADSENKTYLMGSDTFEDESDLEEEEEEETNENLLKTRFEIGKLKVVFEKADQNQDGMLTKSDIEDLIEGRSGRREDVERFRRWCKKVGVDLRGGIDYIFKFFDRQQSGVVDWHSFAAALEADIRLDLVRQETLRLAPDKSDEIRIRGGFTHVLVVARVRPINKNERKKAEESRTKKKDAPLVCVQVSKSTSGHHLVGIEKPGNKKAVLKSQARPKRNFYAFDKVFGPTSTTPQIYRSVIVPNRLVERFLDGISVTIFAYVVVSLIHITNLYHSFMTDILKHQQVRCNWKRKIVHDDGIEIYVSLELCTGHITHTRSRSAHAG